MAVEKFEELLYQFTLLCVDMGSLFLLLPFIQGSVYRGALKNQSDEIDKAYLLRPIPDYPLHQSRDPRCSFLLHAVQFDLLSPQRLCNH